MNSFLLCLLVQVVLVLVVEAADIVVEHEQQQPEETLLDISSSSRSNSMIRQRKIKSVCRENWTYNACCGGCGKSFSKKSKLIAAINDYVVDKKYGIRTYGRINCWDVSLITNMEELFYAYKTFNSNINCWDVSSVTKMNSMFQEASTFNRPLDNWDLSNVENLTFMFSGAATFHQNLCSWHQTLSSKAYALSMFSFTNCPDDSDPNPGDPTTPMCQRCS